MHLEATKQDIIIRLENVSKRYKGTNNNVLNNLSLTVKRNEIYGFIGVNGAGKTTTIKLILGLLKPDSGNIYLFNDSINTNTIKKIGFAPESPAFPPNLTVLEVLELSGKLLDTKIIYDKFQNILNTLSLEEYKNFYASDLSKGLKQRLALACAMIHDPELYVLDEPASGLDPIGRSLIKGILMQLKSNGKTIFFSTHILSDVIEICDRFGIIHNGSIVYEQSVSEFLNNSNSQPFLALEKLFIEVTSKT